MRLYAFSVLSGALFLSLSSWAGAKDCSTYLKAHPSGNNSIGIYRLESLKGKHTPIIDVSDTITERLAMSDNKLRVANLTDIFSEGKLFLGFGRPNVYLAIPGINPRGLGYSKVDAKSLKRADTKIVETFDRVQSGLLLVFKDLKPDQVDRIIKSAEAHQGTRRWTCVNANCHILSDAGFTLNGEPMTQYFFPVRLFHDIVKHGLELDGQPVAFDIVKTTPGYLEDIGLSITHAVLTTLCRHGEKACSPLKEKIAKNTYLMKIQDKLGLALFKEAQPQLQKPIYEPVVVRPQIPEDQIRDYNLRVSEPSKLGTILRLLWGPHTLFEIDLPSETINQALPDTLKAFPDPNPSTVTRLKKHFLFSQTMVGLIRSQLSHSYMNVGPQGHDRFFDMIRTHDDNYPNKYNFVLTGDRLIVMKLELGNEKADWVLSKHVLMSNYSSDVRLAGELWKSADGTIHFNNNSGTYKPGSDLSNALSLFEKLFPGVKIQSHEL